MSSLWVFDGLWRPSAEKQSLEENSKTDYALMEEASRYRNAPNFFRPLVCVFSFSPFFFFWSDSIGEYYDRSGAVLDASQRESPSRVERRPIGRKVSWQGSGGGSRKVYARKRVPDFSCPMKLRLVSWNVRGANDSSKRKVIKAMIRSQRADLFCIQETKIQIMLGGGEEFGFWEVS
ncbi:hypothetical protein CK203_089264 [Vitis vinifera]|uniref:Endonuclease/exonuclease/phosphatase domain-containing protein n=1 Tax=Vitis vinifera TaxID=29760 RepID=A0A438CZV5_VITVI|nr:hypothetical protein CK203_089264 [Vitis vinifera]